MHKPRRLGSAKKAPSSAAVATKSPKERNVQKKRFSTFVSSPSLCALSLQLSTPTLVQSTALRSFAAKAKTDTTATDSKDKAKKTTKTTKETKSKDAATSKTPKTTKTTKTTQSQESTSQTKTATKKPKATKAKDEAETEKQEEKAPKAKAKTKTTTEAPTASTPASKSSKYVDQGEIDKIKAKISAVVGRSKGKRVNALDDEESELKISPTPAHVPLDEINFDPDELEDVMPDPADVAPRLTQEQMRYLDLQARAKRKHDLHRQLKQQKRFMDEEEGVDGREEGKKTLLRQGAARGDDVDLEGAFEELNRYLHSKGKHGEEGLGGELERSKVRKGLGGNGLDYGRRKGQNHDLSRNFAENSESSEENGPFHTHQWSDSYDSESGSGPSSGSSDEYWSSEESADFMTTESEEMGLEGLEGGEAEDQNGNKNRKKGQNSQENSQDNSNQHNSHNSRKQPSRMSFREDYGHVSSRSHPSDGEMYRRKLAPGDFEEYGMMDNVEFENDQDTFRKNSHKNQKNPKKVPNLQKKLKNEPSVTPERPDDSYDEDAHNAQIDQMLRDDEESYGEDETSEFTMSESPIGSFSPNSAQHSQNSQNSQNSSQNSPTSSPNSRPPSASTAPSQDQPIVSADSSSGSHQGPNNGSNGPNNNSGDSPDSTSPPSSGSNGPSSGSRGFGRDREREGKQEKHWPRFNQDVYNRLYSPNSSISPKLSSCLILPLSHTMRPLFPGLYCPVTVRDPATITEILKQTYRGFPYISVFLRKGKGKDDIFNQTDPSKVGAEGGEGTGVPKVNGEAPEVSDEPVDPENLHTVGTFAHIFNITHLSDGSIHMLLVGLRRVELESVKYDIVPTLSRQAISSLVQSTVPNAPTNEPVVDDVDLGPSGGQYGAKKRRGGAAGTENGQKGQNGQNNGQNGQNSTKTHNNRDIDSPVTSQEPSGQEILQSVMETDASKYPELTNPANAMPKHLKRVLVGNITHHDETTAQSNIHNEDGSLKSPMELSRQEETYKVYTVEILAAVRELLQQSSPGILEQLQYLHSAFDFTNPVFVADFIANLTNASPGQMQQLLGTFDVVKRLHLTLLMVKREVEMSRFHSSIQTSVEDNLRKTQREFYLKQQLQQIKKELGMEKGDEKQTLSNKFKSRVKDRWDYIPQYAKTVIEDELSKLETLESSSSEYNVTRNYLDWLTVLPWQHTTDEVYDIKRTEMTLNEEHYGMQDVKDRILEFVAVGKLLQKRKEKAEKEELLQKKAQEEQLRLQKSRSSDGSASTTLDITPPTDEFIIQIKKDRKGGDGGTQNDQNGQNLGQNGQNGQNIDQTDRKKKLFSTDNFTAKEPDKKHQASTGKIMLFVGPPGIGKTSIGKSIAKSLNREFFRFSVGGLSDVSEIKGHRRTYVGALPGKIVQALKKTQCSNPVILIDEIDKIGRGGNHGDPSSALLEVLDPEQNSTFTDHYMDISIDLSKVLFLCTANKMGDISGPLRDRMDVVELSGYIQQEKEHIAKHYLEPQLLQRCGLDRSEAEIDPATISHLVKWYCREAGVRTLQKYLEMILRKVAFRVVRNDPLPIRVTVDNLSEYIGQEVYQSERLYVRTPVGVGAGLAWSAAGGSTMYIESAVSRTIFNRKAFGLPALASEVEEKKGGLVVGDDGRVLDIQPRVTDVPQGTSVDAIEIVQNHHHNTIHTTVDPNTNDTQILITGNDQNVKNSPQKGQNGQKSSKSTKKSKKSPKSPSNDSDEGEGDEDEEVNSQGTGSLKLTGSLGEVMKESASIAYTLAKHYLHVLAADYEHKKIEMEKMNKIGSTHIGTGTSPDPTLISPNDFDLGIQDDPVDPLNCRIPVLRPPVSNSTSTASKIANTNLNYRQNDFGANNNNTAEAQEGAGLLKKKLKEEMQAKIQALEKLQEEVEALEKADLQENEEIAKADQLRQMREEQKQMLDRKGNHDDQGDENEQKGHFSKTSENLGGLRRDMEALEKKTQCEDDLFSLEIQPIVRSNPQRFLRPGAVYTDDSTNEIRRQYIPVKEPNFFNSAHIHIHAPQGATPKDGPSAGIALLSVLMSQALQRPLVNNIAMTGEVSLTGKVLPIGGLREKIIGARQSNIYHLIVPKANMHDIADLPAFITSGLTIYFAESCEEVLRIVFGAPFALGGEKAKPTLIKKYDTFDGDAELEIIKMQRAEMKEAGAGTGAGADEKNDQSDQNDQSNDKKGQNDDNSSGDPNSSSLPPSSGGHNDSDPDHGHGGGDNDAGNDGSADRSESSGSSLPSSSSGGQSLSKSAPSSQSHSHSHSHSDFVSHFHNHYHNNYHNYNTYTPSFGTLQDAQIIEHASDSQRSRV